MLCVVCLKNNASLMTFMCSYCGNVPVFQKEKNKVDGAIIRKFADLDEKTKTQILRLTNQRLNCIVRMNLKTKNSNHFEDVVEEFSLKTMIKEYVELAQLGLDLKMKLKIDPYWAVKINYEQYRSPRDLV